MSTENVQPLMHTQFSDVTGQSNLPVMLKSKSESLYSNYCYRHRPEAQNLRVADEHKMTQVQHGIEQLPFKDQQAITHIWSLFSAAPSKNRMFILQGLIAQCCFPQLSLVSREVHEQLKIDFMAALPTELSIRVLCFLDAVSLCRAAQVSRRWRQLADDDALWRRMCEQHIHRKCHGCGLALPLLDNKVLSQHSQKREATPDTQKFKRQCVLMGQAPVGISHKTPETRQAESEGEPQARKFRPWKEVFKDRHKIRINWKQGRYRIETFRGHSDGVSCLQFDENILATGSYDHMIKIWNVQTGVLISTLRGHQNAIKALRFDEQKLVSGGLDNTLRVWNWRTGVELCTLSHDAAVEGVDLKGDMVASGSMDTTVRIWNFKTQQHFRFRGHTDCVNQVRLDLASRTIFSASDDFSVKMWDLDTQNCLATFGAHSCPVKTVLLLPANFEPDEVMSDEVMSEDGCDVNGRGGGGDGEGEAENEGEGEADVTGEGENEGEGEVEGEGEGEREGEADSSGEGEGEGENDAHGPLFGTYPPIGGISGGFSRGSSMAKTEVPPQTGKPSYLRYLYGSDFQTEPSRALPPRYIITGAMDALRLWDTATGRCLRTMMGHLEGVWALEGDALRIVTGGEDGKIKIWDARSGKCELTIKGQHNGSISTVGLSDTMLASGGMGDCGVRLYNFGLN